MRLMQAEGYEGFGMGGLDISKLSDDLKKQYEDTVEKAQEMADKSGLPVKLEQYEKSGEEIVVNPAASGPGAGTAKKGMLVLGIAAALVGLFLVGRRFM